MTSLLRHYFFKWHELFSSRITSSALKHFGVSPQTIPFYELINFENLDVELILTRVPMHDKKAFHVAKKGMPLPGKTFDTGW